MSDTNDITIGRLIRRSILGTITPAERAELDAWIDASPDNRRFYEWAVSAPHIVEEYRSRRVIDTARPARDMELRLRHMHRAAVMRRLRVISVAASLLAVLSLLVWRFMPGGQLTYSHPDPIIAGERPAINLDSLHSGTAKAILITPTGQTRALTATQSGSTSSMLLPPAPAASLQQRELRLDVPRGGEFKIVLEDSTEVWLNSQSTLRYPEAFGPVERRIALSGEAYLQVRKDSDRPFYVETADQVIRVYGTSFNLRAYPDETSTFTTLESGSISLTLADGGNSGEVFLSRGHQAILDHATNRLDMTVVDPAVVTSWRHGRFVFEDQPLDRIMRDLSRWYDFRYEFSDPSLGRQVFMGSIPRYSDFRTAIQILENCGDIRFTVTPDNTILISPSSTRQ